MFIHPLIKKYCEKKGIPKDIIPLLYRYAHKAVKDDERTKSLSLTKRMPLIAEAMLHSYKTLKKKGLIKNVKTN